MNTQNRFTSLLPDHLPDEAAFILWECLRELTMICEEKYYRQINRECALRIMRDEGNFEDTLAGTEDRQMDIPF